MFNWTHKSIKLITDETDDINPFEYIREEAQKLVIKAMEKEWEGPPFNPIKLAELMDIQLKPSEFIKDARISLENETPVIEYNPNQRYSRINFSIAHEIAHTFFPDWKEEVRNREPKENVQEKELEILCDIGASEILLPYANFSLDANSLTTELKSLFDLSEKYQASLESVFLRYCEVINNPCAIFVCSFEDGALKVDYSKSSRRSNIQIPFNFQIPENSIAYYCKRPGHTDESIEKWKIFNGSEYHVYAVGLAPLKGTTTHRVGLFIKENPDITFESLNSFKKIRGDATDPRGDGDKVIVQVVNTVGAMGAGFGKAISTKWPNAEKELKLLKKEEGGLHLGRCNLVDVEEDISIFQIVAQEGVKSKRKQSLIDYKSLQRGLQKLAEYCNEKNSNVHMPPIGSGFAGGNWNIIEGMIYNELVCENLEVTVYFLPGKNKTKADQKNLFSE